MPSVSADPEKLRNLASALRKAAEQCEQIARTVQRGLDAAGWKDSERVKFEQEITATLKPLLRSADQLKSQHAPQLQRKAQALEQYRG